MTETGVRRAKAAFLNVIHPAIMLQPEAIGSVMDAHPVERANFVHPMCNLKSAHLRAAVNVRHKP
jgi:hypothetical protein